MEEYKNFLIEKNSPKILSPINKNNDILNNRVNFTYKMISLEKEYPSIWDYTVFQDIILRKKMEDDYSKLQQRN